MSFKDDVMFYLSKGRIFNGVNIYEDEDEVEDQDEFDKEDEKEEDEDKKDTKKKKCPDCGKEDCECDKDEDDGEAKAAVKDAKTDDAIKRVIKMKAKARGKGPAPDFGATPEEGAMALDAEIALKNKKKKNSSVDNGIVSDDDGDRVQKDKHCGVSTKTVADDEDDQYHSSVKTKKDDLGVGVNGACNTEKATMREEILAYLK